MPRPTFRPGLLCPSPSPSPFPHRSSTPPRPNRPACATTASPPGPLAGTLNCITGPGRPGPHPGSGARRRTQRPRRTGRFDAPARIARSAQGQRAWNWWKMPAAPTARARCRKTPCRCRR
ncbi:hypothetical protein ACPA9J_32640 [Pseudomonas aeruginosa]